MISENNSDPSKDLEILYEKANEFLDALNIQMVETVKKPKNPKPPPILKPPPPKSWRSSVSSYHSKKEKTKFEILLQKATEYLDSIGIEMCFPPDYFYDNRFNNKHLKFSKKNMSKNILDDSKNMLYRKRRIIFSPQFSKRKLGKMTSIENLLDSSHIDPREQLDQKTDSSLHEPNIKSQNSETSINSQSKCIFSFLHINSCDWELD